MSWRLDHIVAAMVAKWWTPLIRPFLVSTLDFCTCTFTMVTNVGYPETTHPPFPAFSMTSSQFVNFSYPRTNSQKSAKIQTFPFRVAFLNYPKSSDHFRHPWYQKTTNLRGEYQSGMIFFHIKQKNKFASTSSAPRSQPQNWGFQLLTPKDALKSARLSMLK